MYTNCSNQPVIKDCARAAEAIGAWEAVTMSSVAIDLIITTVIGGILWVLASFVGLI